MNSRSSPLERIGYFTTKQQGIFRKYLRVPLPYLRVIVKNYRDLYEVPILLPRLIKAIDGNTWSNMENKTQIENRYRVFGVPAPYLRTTKQPVAGVKVTRLYESVLIDIERFLEHPVTLYMHSGFETSAVTAAAGIVKEAINKGVNARMISFGEYLDLMKAGFDKNGDTSALKPYDTARLLAVYMIGTEYTTAFVKPVMQSLISRRRAEGLTTILVSHLLPTEFESRYDCNNQAVCMKFEDESLTTTVDELLKYMMEGRK